MLVSEIKHKIAKCPIDKGRCMLGIKTKSGFCSLKKCLACGFFEIGYENMGRQWHENVRKALGTGGENHG